jgi:hypothetical protein
MRRRDFATGLLLAAAAQLLLAQERAKQHRIAIIATGPVASIHDPRFRPFHTFFEELRRLGDVRSTAPSHSIQTPLMHVQDVFRRIDPGQGVKVYSPFAHLIDTTARPRTPHPLHRTRSFRSSTLTRGSNPSRVRNAGVSKAVCEHAAQSTLPY